MRLGIVQLLKLVKNGGLQSGKGKVEGRVFETGAWKLKRFGVAGAGVLFDLWSAWVGQLEHSPDFIKRLSSRVIDGSPHEVIVSKPLHVDKEGVAAGNDKSEVRLDFALFH